MPTLGHVVYYVRNLQQSIDFYSNVVGLEVTATLFNHRAASLTGGSTHHELLLIEVGTADGPPQGHRIGLYHVGWKIGDTLDELRRVYQKVQDAGYQVDGMSDHTVTQSLYVRDPDGNEVELYVDNPTVDWRSDDSWLKEPIKPLRL